MTLHLWIRGSITTRLVAIATLPAFVLFCAIVVTLYFTNLEDARHDVRDRARLTAAALAEGTRYSVVSGNHGLLEATLRSVIEADASIAAIEVQDPERRRLGQVGDPAHPGITDIQEAVIRAAVPDVDLFDKEEGQPHVSGDAAPASRFTPGPPIGYVRVFAQVQPILEARRQRMMVAVLLVVLASLASALAGLALAQRLRKPLHEVMRALRQVRRGDYDLSLPATRPGEIGELQRAIIEMAKAMSVSRQELEALVQTRTAALQRAVAAVEEANTEKRRLIARGNALIEEERKRLATEIHDHMNASLIAIQLEAQRIRPAAELPDPAERTREIEDIAEKIKAVAAQAYAAARGIVRSLRPEVLDMLGLHLAVEELIRHYSGMRPQCRFLLDVPAPLPKLPSATAITAYRVIQEALTNVIKHAQAGMARVVLDAQTDPAHLRIAVEDDGRGFDIAAPPATAGIGILSMRERAAGVGGTLDVRSSARGTRITATLPLP
jgi:two-component system, NarL family, sensor histidine kinase UhpB